MRISRLLSPGASVASGSERSSNVSDDETETETGTETENGALKKAMFAKMLQLVARPIPDFFIGEITMELVSMAFRGEYTWKTRGKSLKCMIEELLPMIEEIQCSGVELRAHLQSHIDGLHQALLKGQKLAAKVLNSPRRKMTPQLFIADEIEEVEKTVSRFLQGPIIIHILVEVLRLRANLAAGYGREQLVSLKTGGVGSAEEAMEMNDDFGNLGSGFEFGKSKVKEMIFNDNGGIVGITGMVGSGKTTLARVLSQDDEIRSHFDNNVLFLTVSKSPNIAELRSHIWGFLSGCEAAHPMLVILDDVWTKETQDRLTIRIPGCTTVVVSRSTFTGPSATYLVELLREEEALSLFCLCAFGQDSISPSLSENLVKQIADECKGLPLPLKVIGDSLKDRPEKYWEGVMKRLSRGEPANEAYESRVLEKIATSLENLSYKSKECFLDLCAFPEGKKIPVSLLMNMLLEFHDLDEEEAFAILVDLSDNNLLTLVKDPRLGDSYTSYHDLFVTQHDVLRDFALHRRIHGEVNERRQLLMPRRDLALPREWKRNNDKPYNAQLVSIHTGEMDETDWFDMEFPKAEILILNFSAGKYFLPPFINKMHELRTLVIINNGVSPATLRNFSVLSGLVNLRSLWLERVHFPELSNNTMPLEILQKMSLIFCKVNNSFDQKAVDIAQIFPCLSDLTIDHCDDLVELTTSICGITSLHSLSITNCHRLCELPKSLDKLQALQILRLNACPELKTLPMGLCELPCLKYLDISRCVNITSLPEDIGNLGSLAKLDMRDCPISGLPRSAVSLKSLRHVICDKNATAMWDDVEKAVQGLLVDAK